VTAVTIARPADEFMTNDERWLRCRQGSFTPVALRFIAAPCGDAQRRNGTATHRASSVKEP